MSELVYSLEFDQPKGSALGFQLKEVIDFLKFLKAHPKAKTLAINLHNIRFVHPLFILSIAALTDQLCHKGYKIYIQPPKSLEWYLFLNLYIY